jgi:hypothetical protein
MAGTLLMLFQQQIGIHDVGAALARQRLAIGTAKIPAYHA